MTPITTQLPQTYIPQRSAALRQYAEANGPRQYERHPVDEQVIEAEWQSIPSPPAPRTAGMAARAYAQILPENGRSLYETPHAGRVSANYRSMAPQTPRQSGLNIDALV